MSTIASLVASLPLIDLPAPSAPPGAEGFMTILSWVLWGLAAAGILGIIILAITMTVQTRNGHGAPEKAGQFMVILIALIMGSSAGAIVSMFIGA